MSVVATPVVTPYKGLAPFEDSELDALLFFGRERETEVIVANLLASKLTVLYGPSGVGKSSVLRAAVARRLRAEAPAADVVVLDEWAANPTLPVPKGETFLILDQFEEYFLYHDAGPLYDALPALLEQPRVHVLLSLREDALARLDAFQARVPSVLANRLRLDQLDPEAARAAIMFPLERWNDGVPDGMRMAIEAALVNEVLHQVEATPGRIEAPYLQLVMERIWDFEQDAGSAVLRLDTLRRLGGAEAIVSAHLARALSALPPRDAEIATSALKFLVTPSRTKIALPFGDLVGYTNESPVALHEVLEVLASQRILRAVTEGDDEGSRYEIFHDVLAEPVLAWRREYESRTALAAVSRRHRRLAVLAGGAVLIALAMVALTVYAFAQRSEASKQKRTAVVLAVLAKQRQKKAQQEEKVAKQQTQNATASAQDDQKKTQEVQQSNAQLEQSNAQLQQSKAVATQKTQALQVSVGREKRDVNREKRAVSREKRAKISARQQAHRANRLFILASVGKFVAEADAELGVDPVQSVRFALKAAHEARNVVTPAVSNQVEDALRGSLLALWVRGILPGGGGALDSATFSPDGSLVATGSSRGAVRIFRTQTHKPLHSFRTQTRQLLHSFRVGPSVAKVVFSPDGRQLAVAAGKTVLLYDVATGAVVRSLPHGGAVLDVAYAGGGKYLLTGSADRSTRIWDAGTGDLLQVEQATAAQSTIAVSPDGARFAVVSQGQAIARVYDAASGSLVGQVQQPGEVTDLAFSPNGKYLVTTGRRNGFVWDTSNWQQLHVLSGHEAAIDGIAFAPDGRVVTVSVDSSGRVWDPATGASLFTLSGFHQQKVLDVAVSPDGQQIATASADETVRVWNAPLGSTPRLLGGHTDAVTGVSFSPDGSLLLTASPDGTARLWATHVPALRRLGSHQGAVSVVAYDSTGKLALSAGADGTAKLWHADGSSALSLLQGGKVTDASFVGADVLTAGDDGAAKLWRVKDGSLLATYPQGSPVRAAVAAGGVVVTASDDGVVRSWTLNGRLRWSATHGSPVTAAAIGRDGTVATGAVDGTVRLWRGSDGAALATLRGHTGTISSLAFNRSGTELVSGSADRTARIWNVRKRTLIHVLTGHVLGITSVSFSPNGKLALTSSIDGDAWLWNVKTGRPEHKLKFHVSTVSQAAFSPDGRWVVTAGPTAAAIWQVRTGLKLYFLNGALGNLTSAAWSPDSLHILVGDAGGGVETFKCGLCGHTAALRAQAETTLQRLR